MRRRDATGETAQDGSDPDEFRAGAARAWPRSRLRRRSPFESDRQLVLASPLRDVTAILSGPVAMAAWFSVAREPADPDGRVVVRLPDSTGVLHGCETWMTDQHALVFDGDRPAVSGFVSLRSVILPVAGVGTEIWVHLEVPRGCGACHRLSTLERVVDRGLARMQAELDRSSR